jgi:hypothetical protein
MQEVGGACMAKTVAVGGFAWYGAHDRDESRSYCLCWKDGANAFLTVFNNRFKSGGFDI